MTHMKHRRPAETIGKGERDPERKEDIKGPGLDQMPLFLAEDRVLDLVHQCLLVVVFVRHGAAVLPRLLGRLGVGRVGLEDVAGAAPAAVRGAALPALDPAGAVSGLGFFAGGPRKAAGVSNSRLHVLERAGLGRVRVLGHVTGAATARRHH